MYPGAHNLKYNFGAWEWNWILLKYASVQPPDQGPLYIYVEGIFFSSSCSEIPEYQFKDPSKHFLKSLAKVFQSVLKVKQSVI